MVYDLEYELEVIRAFFQCSTDWIAGKIADEEGRLAQLRNPDNEIIEKIVMASDGAEAIEKLIFRAVIGELNSLYEFALQQVCIRLSGLGVPNSKGEAEELVFVSNRQTLEGLLDSLLKENGGRGVEDWPSRDKILEIKELAEGFKHRHRFQPFPESCYHLRCRSRATRRVSPEISFKDYPAIGYDLSSKQVSVYIQAVEELFRWLRFNDMLNFS